MSDITPAKEISRLKRIAKLWPYIVIAGSLLGLAVRVYRGTF